MKKQIFAICVLAIVSLAFVSCEPNHPIEEPVPEEITDWGVLFKRYVACLSTPYEEGSTITLKREDRQKEKYIIEGIFIGDEEEPFANLMLISDNYWMEIMLIASVEKESSWVAIYGISDSNEDDEAYYETQVIHSGDKIYLKDIESGKYVCVLKMYEGIVRIEDTEGHTWTQE